MAVQLRVGRVALEHAAGGCVPVLGGHEVAGGLLDHLAIVTTANRRHRLCEMADRLADGDGVRGLDLPALGLTGERPHRRDRLGRRERQVDAAGTAAVGSRSTQPPPAAGMLAFHQRDEVAALDAGALDPEPRERVRRGEPLAGGLGGLPGRGEVVVAALGRDRLALEVAGVPAAFGGADAGCGHHKGY